MILSYERELILAHILKKTREYVLAHPEIRLNKNQSQLFQKMIERRGKKEPLAYILGQKGFYGLDFKVNEHSLIPRPETELLVEQVISDLRSPAENEKIAIIDIGTGSGNIIISLAKYLNSKIFNFKFFGIDISDKALRVAKFNARINKANKIKFIKSNLLDYFLKNKDLNKFKKIIIIANLPYLSKNIYTSSMEDVLNYEPRLALLSGNDGLSHYKKLFQQIKILKNIYADFPIFCYIEIGPEQKNKINNLIRLVFPKSKVIFKKDLAKKWRTAVCVFE
jgi:release factor glutamine methyltransferase